jgi:hypothetical protein
MDKSTDMNFEFPHMSTGMKKLITGYLVIFVLLIGTVIGLQLVQQVGVGETRRQAAGVTNGAELSFNTLAASARILVPGKDSVTVPISMATNGQQVTATDITVQFPTNLLAATNMTNAGFFDAGTTTYGSSNTTIQLIVSPAAGRIAVGAPCDKCYLGSSTPAPTPGQPTLAPCATNPTPQCYPKATNQNGIVSNLTLTAKAGVVGHADLTFAPWNETAPTPTPPGTAIAALGSDTDVIGTSTFAAANKLGICVAYDFDKNGSTNTGDILRVSTLFNSHPGDGKYNVAYDLNGTNGAGDGVINTGDILLVSTKFNTSCTP